MKKNQNKVGLILLLASSLLVSCAIQANEIRPNRKAFAYVRTTVQVKVPDCKVDKKTKEKSCEMKDLGKKTALGSGTFFKYKNIKAFISAGHVCLGPAFEIWENLPNKSKIITSIMLYSYTGKVIKGEIRYVNIKYDICIIDIAHPKLSNQDLPTFSKIKPKKNQKFYSVSAPAGIFATGMVPVYEGRYQGDNRDWSFYTIPTAPGASGAPIYNSDNHIVGIIQRTNLMFKQITLSIKFQDLANALNRYEEIIRDDIEHIIE
jgi:hypothetical protein